MEGVSLLRTVRSEPAVTVRTWAESCLGFSDELEVLIIGNV